LKNKAYFDFFYSYCALFGGVLDDLSRIKDIIGIEYFLDPAHQVDLRFAEQFTHVFFLGVTDPMLA
jgi:hypothetical protein